VLKLSNIHWDELFAFWNGVYDETIDSRVNSGGPGAVQKKRDSDFGTSFRESSLQAIIDSQQAFSGGFKKLMKHSKRPISQALPKPQLNTQHNLKIKVLTRGGKA